ncbi:ATP-binding protein [Rhodococcus jostii]|uniref:ATP-binding protein n=1 Tax=Rhodococcus jostii TaxID=132919 RepID=UPI000932B02B|nr:LuxR C-terminal-related transcriptional regulator [Rhodococcus jostii]
MPADLTTFVGRRSELAAARKLLSDARLVTLTGVGGVGKTRLATQLARSLRRAFADGVWIVELATLRDETVLAQTVIDALDITEGSTRSRLEVLRDFVRHREILIVMDNCEHLLTAAATLIDSLLRRAPGLRVLATSRQALGVPGEHLMPIRPLPIPIPGKMPESGMSSEFAAVTLFVERAAAVVPDFVVTSENEPQIVQICQQLEGLPLAIELAAARLRVLAVGELYASLSHRFTLLTGGSRTVAERHQTLRATVDWSFDLCTGAEQKLWARASAFAGTFDLEGALAVCGDTTSTAESILETITGLVDKSILAREEDTGRVRFRMLETIREYGESKLDPHSRGTEVRQRHLAWCVGLVERAAQDWFGPAQERWCIRLRTEYPNLRVALEYCLTELRDHETGLRLASPYFLWMACGSLAEGRYWLDRALALSPTPSIVRGNALWTNAFIANTQGELDAAEAMAEECRSLGGKLNDQAIVAAGNHMLGCAGLFRGELAAACELMESALEDYLALGIRTDPEVNLRFELGLAYLFTGRPDLAFEQYDYCRRVCDEHQAPWLLSYALWGIGLIEFTRGELHSAATHVREGLLLKRVFRDTLGLAVVLDTLAWITAADGDALRAATLLGAAAQQWKTFSRQQLFGYKDFVAQRERCETQARRQLGDKEFADGFSRGAKMSIDDLLTYALGDRAVPKRPQPPVQDGASTSLTRRQREICQLIGDGLTNKEIAAKLVISLRTAESHVQHILTKLGFTSRAQVAALVAQQRTVSSNPLDGR